MYYLTKHTVHRTTLYTVFEYTNGAETMKMASSFSLANIKRKDSFYELRLSFRTYTKYDLYKLRRELTVFTCDTIKQMDAYIKKLPELVESTNAHR